jgi:hypothetical protein
MYYISSNADWSDSTCFFFCYNISINCLYISGMYPKCIIYHPTPIGATRRAFSFVMYQSTACILVECTQNVLYIIQRRSIGATRRAFSFFIYQSTAYSSGVYPKFITYHPTPIGATRAFCLLYINQLPVVEGMEWSVPKIYYVSSNADRSNSRFSFVIYHSTAV